MGEGVLLELSWQAWLCASFAQAGSERRSPYRTGLPSWHPSRGAREVIRAPPYHSQGVVVAPQALPLPEFFLPHSLHLPDRAHQNSSRRLAPPQLPQPLACLAQECKGGRETGQRLLAQEVVLWPELEATLLTPTPLGPPPDVFEGWGLRPSLPRSG